MPNRMSPQPFVGVLSLVVICLAVAAAACGAAQKSEPGAAVTSPAPAPAASMPAVPPPVASAAAPATAGADPVAAPSGAQTAAPIAVQDGDVAGFEVALMEVKRTSGDTITVKWQYRNKGKEMQRVEPRDEPYTEVDAAYLIDPINKKKYLVVRDEKNVPIGSSSGSYQVQPNEYLSVWAKFPAPPAGVDKISIYVPHTAPFEDVPVK